MVISISDVKIAINAPYEINSTNDFADFVEDDKRGEYIVNLVPVDRVEKAEGNLLFFDIEYCIYEHDGKHYRYFYDSMNDDVIYARSTYDSSCKTVTVEYLPNYKQFLDEDGNTLFHIGLEHILLQENRLILHASCIETEYGGVLFTGPSGAGKSTQSDLWRKYNNALLINGDRPILSKEINGWYAWGSPYAGSSKIHINKNCKICSIVRVVKSNQNKIVRLQGVQAFSVVFSGITVNDWNVKDVDTSSNLIMDLISEVPVYELACTNTKEAMETLEKALKGE